MPYMITFTINISSVLASIYHTWVLSLKYSWGLNTPTFTSLGGTSGTTCAPRMKQSGLIHGFPSQTYHEKNVCRAYHSPSNMKKLACNMFKTMVLIRYGRLYHNVNPNRRGNLISSIPQCESKRNWCNSVKKYVNGLRTIPFMGKGSIF